MTESLSKPNPLAFIIEDNEGVAEICRVALTRAEFEVELLPDGQSALGRLAVTTPMLVILDLHLPKVPGQQVLQYIRASEHLAETLIILASADIPQVKELLYEADYVLEKPFGFVKLYELVMAIRHSYKAP